MSIHALTQVPIQSLDHALANMVRGDRLRSGGRGRGLLLIWAVKWAWARWIGPAPAPIPPPQPEAPVQDPALDPPLAPSEDPVQEAPPEPPQCMICLEDLSGDREVVTLECVHTYHLGCISQMLQKRPTLSSVSGRDFCRGVG